MSIVAEGGTELSGRRGAPDDVPAGGPKRNPTGTSPQDEVNDATMADIVRDDSPVHGPTRRVLVVLVRHGESLWNAEHRFQGQRGTGLSPRGHEQARGVDRYLRAAYPSFHRVFSSDLPRAVETARPFLRSTGLDATLDDRWREIDLGTWGGRPMSDIAREFPDEVAASRRGEDIPRGGGETFDQLRKRVWSAMSDLVADPFDDVPPGEDARAVVFTHGGPIRVAAAEAMDLPPHGVFWLAPPANGSLTVLRHVADTGGDIRATTLVCFSSATSPPEVGAAGAHGAASGGPVEETPE